METNTVYFVRCRACGWEGRTKNLEFWWAYIATPPQIIPDGHIVAGACPKCGKFHFDEVSNEV